LAVFPSLGWLAFVEAFTIFGSFITSTWPSGEPVRRWESLLRVFRARLDAPTQLLVFQFLPQRVRDRIPEALFDVPGHPNLNTSPVSLTGLLRSGPSAPATRPTPEEYEAGLARMNAVTGALIEAEQGL
jgi:hypothetical protein